VSKLIEPCLSQTRPSYLLFCNLLLLLLWLLICSSFYFVFFHLIMHIIKIAFLFFFRYVSAMISHHRHFLFVHILIFVFCFVVASSSSSCPQQLCSFSSCSTFSRKSRFVLFLLRPFGNYRSGNILLPIIT
jgi:hypothetical protein